MSADTDLTVQRVRRLIALAEFRSGERLGSERGLCERLGVTRSALRDALDRLERRGEIRRAMGRAGGVFVSDGKIERNLNTIQGVPDMLRQQGFHSATTVLRSELRLATASEQRHLGIPDGQPVVRLVRRRDADGVPLSLDAMTLPARLLPGLQKHDLSTGIYRLLQDEYGIMLSRADETIDISAATPEQAATLGIAPGTPLFELWRVAYDTQNRPVEYAHDYFRADRTRITMQRYGARWKRVSSPGP